MLVKAYVVDHKDDIRQFRRALILPFDYEMMIRSTGIRYMWDQYSEAADDNDNVLEPIQAGVGRWLKEPRSQGPAGAAGADGAPGNDGADGAAGAAGAAGTQWYDGAGAPAGGTGINGDYYLNTTNGDVYKKAAGAWGVVGNLKGSTGATGDDGPAGADGDSDPLGLDFFAHNDLLPSTTYKEELLDWPAPDYQNLASGTLSRVMSRARFLQSGNPGNFGYDTGALRDEILAIAFFRGVAFNIGWSFSNVAVAAAQEPDGSYLFVTEPSISRMTVYKKAAGAFTVIASESTLFQTSGATIPTIGIAAYYKDTGNLLKLFVKFGHEQWFPVIELTDASFTTMRYVTVRISGNAGNVAWICCPMGIYHS